ncbi:hypothetical protein [Nocardiopsis alba]|jgi:hypothetical protein|uniref:hypothetical protein n=1 Tax=Nocardiopsis alba TaxID=53437 RepID=UPI0033D8E575
MITAAPGPDDEPGADEEARARLEETLNLYRRFVRGPVTGPPGTGKTDILAPIMAEYTRNHKPLLFTSTQARALDSVMRSELDQALDQMRDSLQTDSSGRELTPSESLEKQRGLLAEIVEELTGQREDARLGEAKALGHQRRALRIAAWSLGVAALALLAPIVEIVLKLLGVDL